MTKDKSSIRTISLFVFIILSVCCDGKFLGGSINWHFLGGKVRFTYRLTWEIRTGPCGAGCSQANVNTPGTIALPLSILSWTCTSGCQGYRKLHDVNYVTTSVGTGPTNWEQGEGSFSFTPPVANGKYEITLTPLLWSTAADGPGKLRTTLDLRVRSDTNIPNASPIAAVQPTIGIQSGCETTIALPIIDPDADTIKCRLAGPADCDHACTTLTGIKIDTDKCTVTIPGTLKSGEYRLTAVVEDFPRSVIRLGGATSILNQPLSTVPLQLTVRVIPGHTGCGQATSVTTDTGPTVVVPPLGSHTGNHTVHVSSARQTEAIISTSAGVITSQSPDTGHPGNILVDTRWTPNLDQDGPAFTCVWPLQHDGITSQQHCFTINVRDPDDCSGGSKCLHGGTCIDLYKRFTCKCLVGFTSNDCSVHSSCASSNPCLNGTCEERHGQLFCICVPGYTGRKCDARVDHCALSPCLHGGTCTDKVLGSTCACTAQYTGRRCQTQLDVYLDMTKIYMAGVVTEAEDAYSSGTPGIQTPLHSTGSSITATLFYKATVSSDSQGVQVVDYIKVADNNKQSISVFVDNKGPALWPIGVAFGGLLLTALAGCGVWWCCVAKLGKNKSVIDPDKQWARRSSNVRKQSIGPPGSPVSRKEPRKTGNKVTQVETNTGTQVSGGAPRILNIYQSSAKDPHLHKCGTGSRGDVYHNNTFW